MFAPIWSLVFLLLLETSQPMVLFKSDFPSRERYNFFDTELLKVLSENEGGNLVVSPASIKLLLGMLLEGAAGQTAEEIRLALRLPRDSDSTENEFDTWLSSLQLTASSSGDLKIASRIFVSRQYEVKPEFESTLKTRYKTGITPVNFRDQKETSRLINSWASEKTCHLIKSVVRENQIDVNSKLMLLSTVYFKGLWETPFTSSKRFKCFMTSDNNCRKVAMMSETGIYNLGYIDKLDAQAIQIPYKGGKHSMLILLPSKANNIVELARDLVHVDVNSIFSEMKFQEVFVQIPKFEISFSSNLVETLKNLQLTNLIGMKGNFSNLFANGEVRAAVDGVLHSAKLKVNEGGTEGAAATGALFMPLIGGTTTSFVANHPFLFFVMDSVHNSILFAGKLMAPPEADSTENNLRQQNITSILDSQTSPEKLTPTHGESKAPSPLKIFPYRQGPKFRSIKGDFPQKKQPHSFEIPPAANYFYSAEQKEGPLSPNSSAKKEKSRSTEAVSSSMTEILTDSIHIKDETESEPTESSPGTDIDLTSDFWRHHVLFFN